MLLQRRKRIHPIWKAAYLLTFSLLLNGCLFGVLLLILIDILNQAWALLLFVPVVVFMAGGFSTIRYINKNAFVVEDENQDSC